MVVGNRCEVYSKLCAEGERASGAEEEYLRGLVLIAMVICACSTNWMLGVAPKDVCCIPSTVLYDHAFLILLHCVFGNARLQCFEIVRVGE